jgi:hypothetical protein
MSRTTKTLGLYMALCAIPWKAQSTATTSIQVSLTIRESCLVQHPPDTTMRATRPQVSCLHDSPYLTRQMTELSPTQGAVSPKMEPLPTTWLIMF